MQGGALHGGRWRVDGGGRDLAGILVLGVPAWVLACVHPQPAVRLHACMRAGRARLHACMRAAPGSAGDEPRVLSVPSDLY